MVSLPRGIRAVDNHLQPLPPMVRASFLDGPGGGFGSIRSRDEVNGDRLHLCESPSVSTWGKRGANSQAIGKSRGGQTTKVHLLTDTLGRPHTLVLRPGNASDMTGADLLLSRIPKTRYLIADKGYDADRLRASLRDRGTVPVIPGRTNRKRKVAYDRKRYRNRHLVENAFCRLKDFRRVATRYDKLAANFLSAVALAAIIAFWM